MATFSETEPFYRPVLMSVNSISYRGTIDYGSFKVLEEFLLINRLEYVLNYQSITYKDILGRVYKIQEGIDYGEITIDYEGKIQAEA